MIRVLGLVGLLAVLASSVRSQDWRAQLSADAVMVSGGKMLYDEVGLYRIQVSGYQDAQVQVKLHAEAPASGLVSRDNFISLSTLMFTMVFTTALAEAYQVPASQFLQGLDYMELQSPIGTADMELNLVMTNQGMQFEVVNTASGQRTRQTMTWEQVFGK